MSATRPSVCSLWTKFFGGVRRRLVNEDGAAVPLERVGVGIGLQQRGAVTEIVLGVA